MEEKLQGSLDIHANTEKEMGSKLQASLDELDHHRELLDKVKRENETTKVELETKKNLIENLNQEFATKDEILKSLNDERENICLLYTSPSPRDY